MKERCEMRIPGGILLALGLAVLAFGCSESSKKSGGPNFSKADSAEMLTMINGLRTGDGLPALVRDDDMDRAAEGYAVFFGDYWSANGMDDYVDDLDNSSPGARLTAEGVTFSACDETGVISMGTLTPTDAVALMDQDVLMDPSLERVGIAALRFQ